MQIRQNKAKQNASQGVFSTSTAGWIFANGRVENFFGEEFSVGEFYEPFIAANIPSSSFRDARLDFSENPNSSSPAGGMISKTRMVFLAN